VGKIREGDKLCDKGRNDTLKNTWKSPGAGAALIVLLTVGAYLPAMRGGFIWDDDKLITENRMVRASDGLYRFWLTTEAANYYPLTGS
jgi:hypothetical protein